MTIVVNKYKHTPTDNDIYIGRGSIYGNPYSHLAGTKALFIVNNREESIRKYEEYARQEIKDSENFKKAILDLKDKNLVCFCKPKSCHGDILVKLLGELQNDS